MAKAGLVGNSITGDSVEHHGWVATEAVELVQPHNTHSGVSCSPLNSRHYHHLLSLYTCTRHIQRQSPPLQRSAKFPPSRKTSVTSAGVGFALRGGRIEKESFLGMSQQKVRLTMW